MKPYAARVAKFITALTGAAALAVSQGLIVGTAAKWVGVAISVVTALAVYVVPNEQPPVAPPIDGEPV